MGRQYDGNEVDPQFLDTMGMRLVRGRNFRPGEGGVALVSEATAGVLWPDQDPLGKPLPWGPQAPDGYWRRAECLDRLRRAIATSGILPAAIAKRSAGLRPCSSVSQARRTMSSGVFRTTARSLDERLQPDVQVITDAYDREVEKASAALAVIGILGTVANLLSVIGLAGLAGYTVTQRTHEIGLRIALGARARHVVRAILAPMSRPIVIGFVCGALGGSAVAAVLRSGIPTMSGIDVYDPLPYLLALAFFAAVVGLSILAPGRRATRIDPLRALQHE